MKKKKNQNVKNNKKTIWVVLGVIVVVVIVAIIVIFNRRSDRIYEVGKDIKAGEYVLVATGKNGLLLLSDGESDSVYGYYAVCTTKECNIDTTSGVDEIIVNDNVTGKAYVIVEDGQYLKTNDMKLYKVDRYKSKVNNSISYNYELGGSDYYKVGKDLAAGTYTFTGDDFYYAVCSKPSCDITTDEVIVNEYSDVVGGSSTVTVEDGQYLVVSGTKPFTATK